MEIYAPIGNNLTYLNTSYFSGCTSLKEVVLPDSIVELGNTAFKNCVSLENIDLSGIREIGNNTFEGCTSLASVDLSSVNTIGNYAFKGCTALTEVYIPDSVVDMGTSVFLDCDNLQSLTVPTATPLTGWAPRESCSITTERKSFTFPRPQRASTSSSRA